MTLRGRLVYCMSKDPNPEVQLLYSSHRPFTVAALHNHIYICKIEKSGLVSYGECVYLPYRFFMDPFLRVQSRKYVDLLVKQQFNVILLHYMHSKNLQPST